MNLPSLKRIIPALALLLIAFILLVLPHFDAMFFASVRYEQCGSFITSDPAKALAFAHAWRKDHPASPLGQHCEALALFATKDYVNAAQSFISLAKNTTDNPALAARLFVQAAEAYRFAGEQDQAKQAAVAALLLVPNDSAANAELTEIDKKNSKNMPAPAPHAKTL